MFNKTIISQQVVGINLEYLFRAAGIYLFKPHVVNRKLFGVSNLHTFSYQQSDQPNGGDLVLDIEKLLQEIKDETVGPEKDESVIIKNVCERYDLHVQKVEDFDLNRLKINEQTLRSGYVVLNRFLPRNLTVFHPLDVLAFIGIFHSRITIRNTISSFYISQTSNHSPCHSYAFRMRRTL